MKFIIQVLKRVINLLKKGKILFTDIYNLVMHKNIVRVKFTHFWPFERTDGINYPLFKVIPEKAVLTDIKPNIEFFSVLGLQNKDIEKSNSSIKIFFTGEDTEKRYINFDDYCVTKVDMAIGFKYENVINSENYVRYPLWLFYYFGYTIDKEAIKKKVDWFNEQHSKCLKFCTLIASHDDTGIRKEIFDVVRNISNIDCPGKLFHNDNTLKTIYNDNKVEYLNDYMFNICPENVDSLGYVTEKIFECFAAGVIPIYWGSKGNPEPNCINIESVIYYDNKNPNGIYEKIKVLYSDESKYKDFIQQRKLLDSAVDYIYERNIALKNKMEKLFINKLRG